MYKNKIELLASANWTQVNWNLSWQSIIELSELLPKLGQKYEITLQDSEAEHTCNGIYHVLWYPPHSELNGLDDRLTEVLKAYVLQVELIQGEWIKNEYGFQNERKFSAKIISIYRVFEALSQLSVSNDEKLEGYFNINGSRISYYEWDNYLYLTQSAEYVKDEFLFVNGEMGYSLIFINNWVSYSYQCEVCKIELNIRQNKFIKKLLKSSEKLKPTSQIFVADHQVQGALYY